MRFDISVSALVQIRLDFLPICWGDFAPVRVADIPVCKVSVIFVQLFGCIKRDVYKRQNFYKALNYEVECIFCDYGQPASISEKQASQIIAAYYSVPYETIEVKNINIPKLGEICGRNALLIWAAFCKIGFGSYKIVLGIHAGTEYPDCSPQFIDATNRLFDVYTNGTVIAEAPFINWKKADIVAYCRANSLPYHYTYSCEVGSVPPCGRCLSCLDRKELLNV